MITLYLKKIIIQKINKMTRLITISFMFLFSCSLMAQEEQIFTVVEEMPTFLGCENDSISTKKCTETQLIKYIYKNIEYPEAARKKGTKGIVVVSFIINKKGRVEEVKILRNIGNGCAEEVIRVINTMNEGEVKWQAGKQRRQKVNVKYTVPVRFKL